MQVLNQNRNLIQETRPDPKVSVIMAAFNASSTIQASIDSVISQTFQNWELIVVDDCSSDETASIVDSFTEKDLRIRLYRSSKNQGVSATRNFAMEQSKGEWLAFLDSDDLWNKEKLEKQVEFAEENNALITYTATSYMDSSGNISDYILPAVPELSYKALLYRNIMSCSSVMVHRKVMIPFPCGNNAHEDYSVWMQIVRSVGHANGINNALLIYRMHEKSKSAGRIRSAQMIYGSYQQVGYSIFVSLLLTLRYSFHSIFKRFLIRKGIR